MRSLVLLLLAASTLCGEIPLSEYRERRERLRSATPDGVFILAGNTESEIEEIRGGFFQEPNFEYLSGWREPGAVLVITPKEEVLFIPKRNPETEKYTGPKAEPQDRSIAALAGFKSVAPVESLESRLPGLIEAAAKIYALPSGAFSPKLKTLLALREMSDAALPIARLRMIKSKAEIELLQQAADISIEAHLAAWDRMAAGVYEYQVAATMMSTWFERGCRRNAFAPIVGSGPNGVVLHYSKNSRRMDTGDLLLIDAAAECASYAADITRTAPVNRKFTPRQRELYETVLGAHRAAIAAAKPGATLGKTSPNSLFKVAQEYLDAHGKDLHGNPLGRYLIHGVSHHVGLDVHDAWDPALPLQAGMVITMEPGIYIPEENIGIRIEDMLLITDDGAKVLSSALPVDPDEIEKLLARPAAGNSKTNAQAR
jgi:Xaa-Pro aminopeptidase